MSLLQWPCGCLGVKLHKPDAHLRGKVLLLERCGPHSDPQAGLMASPERCARFVDIDPAQAKPADVGRVRAFSHDLGRDLGKVETFERLRDALKEALEPED